MGTDNDLVVASGERDGGGDRGGGAQQTVIQGSYEIMSPGE